MIDVARDLARRGVFIVLQELAPFRYSGCRNFTDERSPEYDQFETSTGIRLESNCGIDTTQYGREWRGVAPLVEVVRCDFTELAAAAEPGPGDEGLSQLTLWAQQEVRDSLERGAAPSETQLMLPL